MVEDKQGNCEVCTGEGVVLDGVCRNCGAGSEGVVEKVTRAVRGKK